MSIHAFFVHNAFLTFSSIDFLINWISHQSTFSSINFLTNRLYSSLAQLIVTFKTFRLVRLESNFEKHCSCRLEHYSISCVICILGTEFPRSLRWLSPLSSWYRWSLDVLSTTWHLTINKTESNATWVTLIWSSPCWCIVATLFSLQGFSTMPTL